MPLYELMVEGDRFTHLLPQKLAEMGGYVTDSGTVDVKRVQVLLEAVAEVENDILTKRKVFPRLRFRTRLTLIRID